MSKPPDTALTLLAALLVLILLAGSGWRAWFEVDRQKDQLSEMLDVANASTLDERARGDKLAREYAGLQMELWKVQNDLDKALTALASSRAEADALRGKYALQLELIRDQTGLLDDVDWDRAAAGDQDMAEAVEGATEGQPSFIPVWLQLLQQGRAGEAAREAVRGMGIGQNWGSN